MESLNKAVVENCDVDKKNGEFMREKVVENAYGKEKSKEINDAINAQVLFVQNKTGDQKLEGGDARVGGVVMEDTMDERVEYFLSLDNTIKGDEFQSWTEFQIQAEQHFDYCYPFWETEDGAYNFWGVEPSTNDWAISFWQW